MNRVKTYIGGDEFFFGFFRKSLKICSGSNVLFRGLTSDFFKANSIIELRKCKEHEKCDRFLVSKLEFNYRISRRNKNFTY